MIKKIAYALAIATAVLSAAPAYAMTHFLTAQWYDGGSHFCRYDDGTVLNVGYHICPLSIG